MSNLANTLRPVDPISIGKRTVALAQSILGLRSSDILLVSFPRSGNTWVPFFLCHLADIIEGDGEDATFDRVNTIMPEFGRSNLLRPWRYAGLDRFVKTHAGYSRLFRGHRVVLVIRDPRDVLVSFHRYERYRIRRRVPLDLSSHIRHPRHGFEGWFRHTKSWLPHATVTVRYEEMLENDVSAFTRMLTALGQHVPEEAVASASARSRFERIREAERADGNSPPAGFAPGFAFTVEGRPGSGHSLLSSEDHALYVELRRRHALDLY